MDQFAYNTANYQTPSDKNSPTLLSKYRNIETSLLKFDYLNKLFKYLFVIGWQRPIDKCLGIDQELLKMLTGVCDRYG